MHSWRASLAIAFVMVFSLGVVGKADNLAGMGSNSSDSSVGKSPILEITGVLPLSPGSYDVHDPIIDLFLGKPASAVVFAGPPPQGTGPGLNFDTHLYFYVYTDNRASANHFAPSGWMGDYGDIKFDDASPVNPADGKTCLQIHYSGQKKQGFGWAGMYWQEPQGNWGNKVGGFCLSGMKRLTFWARGENGGEVIAVFKVGGIQGLHADTGANQIGPITLTKHWEQYEINLEGVNLSKVSGGFAWVAAADDNGVPVTFYLDEIRFERVQRHASPL